MRFTALFMLLIAAMLISVTQTASPLAAQTLTATLASQPQDSSRLGSQPPGYACTKNSDCASDVCTVCYSDLKFYCN